MNKKLHIITLYFINAVQIYQIIIQCMLLYYTKIMLGLCDYCHIRIVQFDINQTDCVQHMLIYMNKWKLDKCKDTTTGCKWGIWLQQLVPAWRVYILLYFSNCWLPVNKATALQIQSGPPGLLIRLGLLFGSGLYLASWLCTESSLPMETPGQGAKHLKFVTWQQDKEEHNG